MNLKRVLTTVIGLPLVILVFLLGNQYVICGLLIITSCICLYEYFNVVKKISKPIEWVGYLSNIYIITASFMSLENLSKFVVFTLPLILLILFMHVIISNMKITFKDVSYTLMGIIYIPFFLMFLELTRLLPNGKILFGFIFVISWATDIFAYLIGRNFGKRMFSKISPKKTIEGCASGLIGAMVVALVYTVISNIFWGTEYSYIYIGIISIILSAISQVGDFVASSIKRFVDVKDYGNIIPGHGGMLDRIDSVLFLAPFCYFVFSIFM